MEQGRGALRQEGGECYRAGGFEKLVKDDVLKFVCKFYQSEPAAAFQIGKNHDREMFPGKNPKVGGKPLLNSAVPN